MTSQFSSVCVICKEGATLNKKLINNPAMLKDLASACKERLSLGQSEMKELTDCLCSMNDIDMQSAHYHSECRKPIVNKANIEKLKLQTVSLECPVRGRGHPSTSSPESTRPKRVKTIPKQEVCLFSACGFCPKDSSEPLHRVLSDQMGKNLIEIKQKTLDDQIRTCVAELEDAGDASALEKYYHRRCLRSAQRTFEPTVLSNDQLIRSLCDEQLIYSIQNTLIDGDVSLNIAHVNHSYISILKRYQLEVHQEANYRKHLKKIIAERLPNVQFVKSLRKNEPQNIVLKLAVTKAMELKSTYCNDSDIVCHLKNIANILCDEMMQHRKWTFNGTFDDFENPPLLQFFLSQLLFGHHVLKVSGMRNEEVDKTVDVACQFLVQNTRSDHQVKHQQKKNDGFLQTV